MVGPQMWSRTIVYMTADPIVEAARRAILELKAAEHDAQEFQFDSVMEHVEKAIAELNSGLPDANLVASDGKHNVV